ncbi:unnamed protein product [Coccothraustes coccothraustes]
MCMGGSQGNPRSPRPLPGCRAGRGAAAEERSLPRSPSSPGSETFRRVRGSSQINHGAALLYQLDFSGRRYKNKQCLLGRSHARDECTTRGQARDVGAPRADRSFLGVRGKSRSAYTVVPPRESRRLSASLARLLYLEQGNFRLRDLAS